MIVIINYGTGNLSSMLNMLKRIGAEAMVSSNISDIEKADKLILPGVGAFDNGMRNLQDSGLVPVLNQKVLSDKTLIMGICLGMQLFTKRSEEGMLDGLGWIDARTIRFEFDKTETKLKVPHMRWNHVDLKQNAEIFSHMYENPRFYFAHSYHVVCKHQQDVLSTTKYGYDFVSSVKRENIIGVQFHPEKSLKFGMKMLETFVRLD